MKHYPAKPFAELLADIIPKCDPFSDGQGDDADAVNWDYARELLQDYHDKTGDKTNTVKRELLSSIRMTTGGEETHPVVIMDGCKQTWVGFGWVDEGLAVAADFQKYPTVID